MEALKKGLEVLSMTGTRGRCMRIENVKPFSQRIHYSAVIIISLVLFSTPLLAAMEEVSDSDLSQVSAQAGITYNWGDSKLNVTWNSFAFSDTDHTPKNWIEFKNIEISGPDGYFTLDEDNGWDVGFPFHRYNTIDITTLTTVDGQTRPAISFMDSTHTTERDWTIGNLVFCNQDLGSIKFDVRNVDAAFMNISTHGAGSSGIEFEQLSNWELKNFAYDFNTSGTSGGSLNLTGIHIAECADAVADNPADPTTWTFSGYFRIGDITGGTIDVDNNSSNAALPNPATFDVLTDNSTNTPNFLINLPMKGTVRVEEVNFGGNNFGPVAIDGITVHHLGIRVAPGS